MYFAHISESRILLHAWSDGKIPPKKVLGGRNAGIAVLNESTKGKLRCVTCEAAIKSSLGYFHINTSDLKQAASGLSGAIRSMFK